MKFIQLLIWVLLMISGSVHALSLTSAAQAVPQKNIYEISTYDDFAIVRITPVIKEFKELCRADGEKEHFHVVAIDLTEEKGRQMYSAALAAAMSDRVVGFGIDGCVNWSHGAHKAYRIDVSF